MKKLLTLAAYLLVTLLPCGGQIINGGAGSVTNEGVNAAIETDPAASRSSLVAAKEFWIDVTDSPYNADPTGAVDATTAIQAALDAAGASATASSTVFVPAGSYTLSDELVIPRAGVSIVGDGQLSTYLNQTVSTKRGIIWNFAVNAQYTAIRHLAVVGLGGDTHTVSGICARSDTGPGNFFASQFIIEDVRIEGFLNGIWAQNSPKLIVSDCNFINNAVGCRFTKSDTFIVRNASMGATGVTASTTGFILEDSSAPVIAGANFGGIIEIGEYGDMDQFINMTGGGTVTVIEPNIERVGDASGQAVVYLAGTSRMKWIGGRIENGAGDSTMANFRVYNDSGGDIPTLNFFGAMNSGTAGCRVVESIGGLYYKCSITSSAQALPITFAATAGGTAVATSTIGPIKTLGSMSGFPTTSAERGLMAQVPSDTTGTADILAVTAKGSAGDYKRRSLINDSLMKVTYSSATALSSAAGAETALLTHSIPAYTMAAIGWTMEIKIIGTFANNTNAKRVRLTYGNPGFYTFYDTGAAGFQNSAFEINTTYAARAAGQGYFSTRVASDDASPPLAFYVTTTSQSYDATLDFKINTTGVAAGDIVIQAVIVRMIKNGSEY